MRRRDSEVAQEVNSSLAFRRKSSVGADLVRVVDAEVDEAEVRTSRALAVLDVQKLRFVLRRDGPGHEGRHHVARDTDGEEYWTKLLQLIITITVTTPIAYEQNKEILLRDLGVLGRSLSELVDSAVLASVVSQADNGVIVLDGLVFVTLAGLPFLRAFR